VVGAVAELGDLAGHDAPVLGLAFHDDLLLATHYHADEKAPNTMPGPGTLRVLDRVTLAEVAPPIPVGWQPRQVVVNPTARRIYVWNRAEPSRSITIIGLDSLQPEGEIFPGNSPARIAVDSEQNMLFVLMHLSGEVIAYDCNDHSEIARVPFGPGGSDLAVDEGNRLLYAVRYTNDPFQDELAVIDTSTLLAPNPIPEARINLPFRSRPWRVLPDPALDRVFVLALGVGAPVSDPGILEVDLSGPGIPVTRHRVTQGGPVHLAHDPFHGLLHLGTTLGLISYDSSTYAPTSAQPQPQLIPDPSEAGRHVMAIEVDRLTSAVAIGDGQGRVTLVHPELGTGDLPHAGPGAPLTMVPHDGVIELFVAAGDDVPRMARWTEATDWDFGLGWVDLPGPVPAGTPMAGLSRHGDRWELYAVRDDRQLWTMSGDGAGTTDGWHAFGGRYPLRAHVAALSRHGGERTVFAVGDDGVVHGYGGVGPAAEATAFTVGDGPAVTPGAPIAAVSRKDDHWDLFVLADDGAVWTTWWSEDDGFNPWGSLGGSFPAGAPITAVSRHRSSLELFAVRDDGQVVTQYWHSEDGWSGWQPVVDDDNQAPVGATVSATCRNEDSIDIFVVRADRRVHTCGWSGHWLGWRPLGGRVSRIGAPLAVRARPGTDQWVHLCWPADGGAVETAWWNRVQANGGWSLENGVRLRVVTESVRHETAIATDTDDLWGTVVTRLWRDGNYLVSGHVHGDSWDPYRFQTQSAVLSPEGFATADMAKGRVDGGGSEPFPWDPKPDRDSYWNHLGMEPVVAAAYDELAAGDPTASLDSKNIGLGGGLDAIVHVVFHDFLDGLVLEPAQFLSRGAIALGREFHELLQLPEFIPGPQSIFVYTDSIGWLNGFNMVLPVLPWHQQLGSLDPFVQHRTLEPWEYDFFDRVFRGTLPDRSLILLTDALGLKKHPFSPGAKGRAFVFPTSDDPDAPVIVNVGEAYESPTTFTKDGYETPGQLLVHELTHVWHLHNTHLSGREWLARAIPDGDYDPPPATTPWEDFGVEEKAATVDGWFARHVAVGLDSSAAHEDDYYPLIHKVRTRDTGD
jgi:hypothetical protein